jgi:Pyruvate/2-oxoacid:ferredoxin oxidoreductase gamma subunit
MPVDINFMIGGEAGQGVQSVGSILAKALSRGGFHVFADQDYESRVRGGHNFFRVRASDVEINALSESVDILIALNKESTIKNSTAAEPLSTTATRSRTQASTKVCLPSRWNGWLRTAPKTN